MAKWFGAMIAALMMLAAPAASAQASDPNQLVRLSLVADRASVAPGETFALALRQVIAPGWHTYWQNPGDAGLPPETDWTLPEGMSVGPFQWPAPHTFVTDLGAGALVNYVYEGEVLLPLQATVPARAQAGDTVTVSAFVSLLVCDDSTCVPQEGEVSLSLPVSAVGVSGGFAEAIEETLAALPQPLADGAATITPQGVLSIAGGAANGLNQRGFGTQEAFLVGIQNRNQAAFGNIQPLTQKVDAHQHLNFPHAQ